MQLSIENCGKIKSAYIEIKGITVIAGENNTGKSTVGKILFCIYNSLYDLDRKIFVEKKEAINAALGSYLASNTDFSYNSLSNHFYFDIEFEERDKFKEKTTKLLNRILEYYYKNNSEVEAKLRELINERLDIDNDYIVNGIFNNFIRSEFKGQINNFNTESDQSKINLSLKEKNINILINKNIAESIEIGCKIFTEAVYIDSPFILDEINDRKLIRKVDKDEHKNYLRRMLRRSEKKNLVEEAILSKRIDNIIKKIEIVAPDAVISKDKDSYVYKDKSLRKPIIIENTSTGLKTFVIIKMLIDNYTIQENGVLILDEPEVHLHPEWQLIFAEIIVLLQKELNLHIVLNTHSPYFLNAIEVFSAKHCISDKCKYYLSYNKDDISEIKDVTNSVQEIYEKLAIPFQKLEDIRANFGECDD